MIVFEWLACFVVLAASATIFLRLHKARRLVQLAAAAICLAIPLIPIDGLNVSQYFLTLVGHLSLTSMCLLAAAVIGALSGRALFKNGEKLSILTAVTASGILLYSASFGVLTFDIYQLGYGSLGMVIVLTALTIFSALFGRSVTFAALVSAAIAFQFHLLASNNLWDYLVDPLLVIYAASSLVIAAMRLFILPRRRTLGDNQ